MQIDEPYSIVRAVSTDANQNYLGLLYQDGTFDFFEFTGKRGAKANEDLTPDNQGLQRIARYKPKETARLQLKFEKTLGMFADPQTKALRQIFKNLSSQ